MRALYSAATGMKSLQMSIDTISNNLANVNTTGYKKQRLEFKDLLYEKLASGTTSDGAGAPVSLEMGQGVMPSATMRSFSQGNFQQTENNLDVAIDGDGFFAIRDVNEDINYTKDGAFKISVVDGTNFLSTSDGLFVQGDGGDIELGEDIAEINIDSSGLITVLRNGETEVEEVGTLQLFTFANPAGLESLGANLYGITEASGEAIENDEGSAGNVIQGYLEGSNVQVVEEMIAMITAQRAYETNSKTIQTADEMLQQANGLKR